MECIVLSRILMLPSDRKTRLAVLETYLTLYRDTELFFNSMYAVTGDKSIKDLSQCTLEQLHRSFDNLFFDVTDAK